MPMKPIYVNDLELEMFRTAITAYDSSINSTSVSTYAQLEEDCNRMLEILNLMEEGHSIRYTGAWKNDHD